MEQPKLHILVVEDEPDQRALIVQMLTANQYLVESADSVEQAIVMIKASAPDLVFSEIGRAHV